MQRKTWLLIALVYLCFAELLSWAPVSDLSSCLIQAEHGQQAADHDDKKRCPAFHVGAAFILENVDGFLERHDKSVIGAFTIVLAISTIGLWLATNKLWEAGERQLTLLAETSAAQSRDMERSMIAANRPWIKVEIQVAGPIFYNVNGANLTLRYAMENIGRSPATNVLVNPRLIAPILSADNSRRFDPRAELRREITEHKSRPPMSLGFSLFPNEKIAQEITVSMSNDEINRATEIIGAIYPTIIGSVSYRMGLDDIPHQTGFIVEVCRNDVPRPSTAEKNRSPAAIWIDEGDVPAADVRLFRSVIDGGYAD
jgi:hypothetical protein